MKCEKCGHDSTAPASLVEEIRKWSSNCYRRGPDGEPDGCLGMMELESILSRYRPSPQADIVGELKGLGVFIDDDGNRNLDADKVEEIIAKYEGGQMTKTKRCEDCTKYKNCPVAIYKTKAPKCIFYRRRYA